MKYLEPEMEVMVLESDDVIRTSDLTNQGKTTGEDNILYGDGTTKWGQ